MTTGGDSDLVVAVGATRGGNPFANAFSSAGNHFRNNWQTYAIALLLAGVVMLILWATGAFKSDGFSTYATGRIGFKASSSQTGLQSDVSGVAPSVLNAARVQGYSPVEGFADSQLYGAEETFLGNRETPYFADVTNRVLRMENREREAIRALGKINQERMRRDSAEPLPWGPFWDEWKKTHPLEEGFNGEPALW